MEIIYPKKKIRLFSIKKSKKYIKLLDGIRQPEIFQEKSIPYNGFACKRCKTSSILIIHNMLFLEGKRSKNTRKSILFAKPVMERFKLWMKLKCQMISLWDGVLIVIEA